MDDAERRELLPEVVRRELGADKVLHLPQGNLWHLIVWFGRARTADEILAEVDIGSMVYEAWSARGFTTEEAIAAIRRQRPELPA